jgi:hypothetical protein
MKIFKKRNLTPVLCRIPFFELFGLGIQGNMKYNKWF